MRRAVLVLCASRRHSHALKEIRRPAKRLRFRLLAFFAVCGPGFITANVDNDPGGILTYSQAGAKFGYALLWTLIPTTIALIVVQETAARIGAVTGKGLHDLIREEFGIRARSIWRQLRTCGEKLIELFKECLSPAEQQFDVSLYVLDLKYFLEVNIARNFLQDWTASLETEPPLDAQCIRLIQYATFDA